MISISGYALEEKMRHNHNIDTYYAMRLKDRLKVLLKTPRNHHGTSENPAIFLLTLVVVGRAFLQLHHLAIVYKG